MARQDTYTPVAIQAGDYVLVVRPSDTSQSPEGSTRRVLLPTVLSDLTNDAGFITGYTVTEGDVTAHQAALSITEAQISDLGTYIASSGVTYENLSANGDIGTGATQVAQGDHNHDGTYATATQGTTADNAVQPAALISGDANNTLSGQVKFWVGTSADYTALGTYDGSTIYLTTD